MILFVHTDNCLVFLLSQSPQIRLIAIFIEIDSISLDCFYDKFSCDCTHINKHELR